jgi:hypothetical protein
MEVIMRQKAITTFLRPSFLHTGLTLLFIFLLSACGGSHPNPIQATAPAIQQEFIPPIEETPSDFSQTAVVSAGKFSIENEFETDGPLADIYSSDTITVGNHKASFTGDVISETAIRQKAGQATVLEGNIMTASPTGFFKPGFSKPQFHKASEITLPDFQGYEFSQGGISLVKDGVRTPLSPDQVNGTWTYIPDTGWTATGGEITLSQGLKVEGNLSIQAA